MKDKTLKSLMKVKQIDRRIRIFEAIYITILIFTIVLDFKLFMFLFILLLIVIVIVAVVEIPGDYRKIKKRKEYDSHYNYD